MMKRFIFILLIISVPAYADWEIAGSEVNSKGEFEVSFYETESVESKDGVVRFWIKNSLNRKLDVEIENQLKDKKYVADATQKLNSGYKPKILSTNTSFKRQFKTDKEIINATFNAIILEQIANSSKVDMTILFYWELDCKKSFIKMLDGTLYDNKGKVFKTTRGSDDGRYIAPSTNPEDWKKMFCK